MASVAFRRSSIRRVAATRISLWVQPWYDTGFGASVAKSRSFASELPDAGKFYVYDAASGSEGARDVIRWGYCVPGTEALQAINPNEVVVLGRHTPKADVGYDIVYNAKTRRFGRRWHILLAWLTTANAVRQERNQILADCDWIMTYDVVSRISAGPYLAWKSYRQDLRNVPLQAGFPWSITWPTEPARPEPIP